jgi:sigma-B regulation protein RsbU (phosphoserine phosphatase)
MLSLHPTDEAARLAAVNRYQVLDTPPDGAFDRITAIAARLFDVPIAIVSVVDTDRIWFKSHHGLPDVTEIPRSPGLCASAILGDGPYVVNDAAADPRTLANPLVAGEMGLRFYAAAPLITSDGYGLGTLCVLDVEPRETSPDQIATLQDLAAVVVDELELRLASRVQVAEEYALRRHAESLANALQASLLPAKAPEFEGMEIATRYRSGVDGLEVGGDFFDVFRVAANDWGVAIGDACGRGARAASLTGLVRWTIRAASVHRFRPSEVLGEVNHTLLTEPVEGFEDEHYATVALARVELDKCGAWVTLACAGHPRPIVVRRAGWVDVRGQIGQPLGFFDDPELTDDRVGLGPGDAIVFYTDGVSEARHPDGDLFGDDRILDVLLAHAGEPADAIATALMEAVDEFAGGPIPKDDTAILVLRVPEFDDQTGIARVTDATGLPADHFLELRYPLAEGAIGGEDIWQRRAQPNREARMRLEPEPGRVAAALHLLQRMLASWRMDDQLAGDIERLTTEVITNAVVHGQSDGCFVLRYDGHSLRVDVGERWFEVPVTADPSR